MTWERVALTLSLAALAGWMGWRHWQAAEAQRIEDERRRWWERQVLRHSRPPTHVPHKTEK